MPDRPHEATPNAAFTARCGRDDMAPGTLPTPHVTGETPWGNMLDGNVRRRGEFWRLPFVLGAPLVAIILGACSGSTGSSTASTSPRPIPSRTAPPTTSPPTVTTPEGGPEVTTFNAPTSFTCLAQDPSQAQVTIGWTAPSATQVAIGLDGAPPPSGIRNSFPFQVPAGPASGPGVTIVFACGPAFQHTITLAWRMKKSPRTLRVVSIAKMPTS
jgi:hypothetical protein